MSLLCNRYVKMRFVDKSRQYIDFLCVWLINVNAPAQGNLISLLSRIEICKVDWFMIVECLWLVANLPLGTIPTVIVLLI